MNEFDSRVSVVIPAHNSERYIEEMLDSIISQTIQADEIIIVDDHSKDNTALLVEEIANKNRDVKLYRLPDNFGPSYARNFGISKTNGKYVLFFDSDDIAEPDLIKYEIEKTKMLEELFVGGCALTHCAFSVIDQNGNIIEGMHRWRQTEQNELLGELLVRNNIVSTSGVLVKKSALEKTSGFNELFRHSEDWDLWLRLAQTGGFGYVDKPLVRLRRHNNNTSSNVGKMLNGSIQVLKQYDIFFIQEAIYKRNYSEIKNICDFVSVLYMLEYWDKGYEYLCDIKEENHDELACFYKGLYFVHLKNYEDAKEMFECVIRYNKRNGAALNNLSAIFALRGDRKTAKEMLDKALSLHPEYIDSKHNLELLTQKADISDSDVKFTYRLLRDVLTIYS